MTSAVRPTHGESLALAEELQLVQRWRAAETVRARVPQDEGQEALLDCLGLLDVTKPADA